MRLLEMTSRLQTIELWEELGAGLVLVLDGMVQFRETEEHRYHECLTVVPMVFGQPRRVFIGGGGDGLAAARLLRFEHVERVVVCDYDPAITELSRHYPELVRLNGGSLNDPRVEVVNDDAYAYLRDHDEVFDLVICDFPDPFFDALGRLYSVELYELVRQRLAPEGLLVVQTLAVPTCARLIGATVESVLPHRRFYRFGPHGFTLASGKPLRRQFDVPSWTRFLSNDYLETMFTLSKDDTAAFDPSGVEPLAESDASVLVREAIVHVHGRLMSYPFFDKISDRAADEVSDGLGDAWVVELGPALVDTLGDRAALAFEALHEGGWLIVLVEDGTPDATVEGVRRLGYEPTDRRVTHAVAAVTADAARLAAEIWSREVRGPLTELEAVTCAPADRAELIELLDAAEHPALLVEAGAKLDRDRRATLLVARDGDGRALALWRLTHALDGEGVEWLGGDPTVRRDSFLLVYLYLSRLQYAGLTLRAPSPESILLLSRLGPCRLRDFALWIGPPRTA